MRPLLGDFLAAASRHLDAATGDLRLATEAWWDWGDPLPLLVVIAPVVWWFFRGTWRELDVEALALRRELAARGEVDYRPLVALTLAALILIMQEYYGRGDFFESRFAPGLRAGAARTRRLLRSGRLRRARPAPVVGVDPHRRLSGPAAGLAAVLPARPPGRLRPARQRLPSHAWIYALCVAVMLPVLLSSAASRTSPPTTRCTSWPGARGSTSPSGRLLYIGQFFALEIFFRGFWLRAMRTFGAGAIWAMVVPYCMIHYGKPYLEACGAMVAGVVLGSLAMRTRSIYAGFLVHVTVAIIMDVLSLYRRHALPTPLTPMGTRHRTFLYWSSLIWIAWMPRSPCVAVKSGESPEAGAFRRRPRVRNPESCDELTSPRARGPSSPRRRRSWARRPWSTSWCSSWSTSWPACRRRGVAVSSWATTCVLATGAFSGAQRKPSRP